MSKIVKIVLIIISLTLALCLCLFVIFAIRNPVTPEQRTRIVSTQQAEKQLTQNAPTSTPKPTNTPTSAPLPTNTPTITPTPKPTNTSTPTSTPTPLPTPITLSGTGDSIVNIEPLGFPAIVQITGNASSRHFAVKSLDENNNPIDLLVNTTDIYSGTLPLDFKEGQSTHRFEVSATGEWTITIKPLLSIRLIEIPATITGSGDDLFAITGATPDTATINGNSNGRHFAVFAYGKNIKLLVNTTDPYNGQVVLPSDTQIIHVTAVGEWSVQINP